MDEAHHHVLAQKTEGGVIVLSFTQPLLSSDAIAEAHTTITATECRSVVLDFQSIRHLVSASLYPDQAPFEPLRELNSQLRNQGGELVLCNLTPEFAELFRIAHLDREFVIRPDVSTAVAYLSEAEINLSAAPPPPPPQHTGRILLPVLLFIATCLRTWLSVNVAYALAVMTILLAHEMGHYLQTRRYGVPAAYRTSSRCHSHLLGRWGR